MANTKKPEANLNIILESTDFFLLALKCSVAEVSNSTILSKSKRSSSDIESIVVFACVGSNNFKRPLKFI